MSVRALAHISAAALACTAAAVFGSMRPAAQQSIVITGVTTQLTTDPADQADPSISGSVVVWTDRRNGIGNDDIFYRDGLDPEVQLTTSTRNQRFQDVSGRIVVYTDVQSSLISFVRAIDLTTNTEIGVFGGARESMASNPRIDGTLVVYQSGFPATLDVWLADLSTGVSSPLAATAAIEANAVVSGSRVVYERRASLSEDADVVVVDLTTGLEHVITGPSHQERPDIDGDVVVYDGLVGTDDLDIFVHNLRTGVTTQVSLPGVQSRPHVSGNFVVFDSAGEPTEGSPNVYLYHIPSATIHPVAVNPDVNDFLNDISGNRLVYTSGVSGNLDVWLYTFEVHEREIAVDPAAHDFGEVTVGSPETTTITISNAGSLPLSVSGLDFTNGSNPFISIVSAPALPAVIEPGAAVGVQVAFTPAFAGFAAATLAITSDDLDTPVVHVDLSGRGVPPPDETAPTIVLSTPVNGATFTLNDAVSASYVCADEAGGSGLAACGGTTPSGSPIDTASVGSRSFTVTATDNAGNVASVTHSYTVTPLSQVTTQCSILGNDPPPSLLDQDLFAFDGAAGEQVTITLAIDQARPHQGDRATLFLADHIRGTVLVRRDGGVLPNTLTARLPAAGRYTIAVAEQLLLARGARFTGGYCLTLESSGPAHRTLRPHAGVE